MTRITLAEVVDGQNVRIHTAQLIHILRNVKVVRVDDCTNVVGTTPIGQRDVTFPSDTPVEVTR
jgi:hypothetical protein